MIDLEEMQAQMASQLEEMEDEIILNRIEYALNDPKFNRKLVFFVESIKREEITTNVSNYDDNVKQKFVEFLTDLFDIDGKPTLQPERESGSTGSS